MLFSYVNIYQGISYGRFLVGTLYSTSIKK